MHGQHAVATELAPLVLPRGIDTEMVGVRLLWEAYGHPGGGSLPLSGKATLRDLKARSELNQAAVIVFGWDAGSGRFTVQVEASGEKVKVRAANIRPAGFVGDQPQWLQSENHFGLLPGEIALAVAQYFLARSVAALSATSRGARAALWLRPDAEPLWEGLLVRVLGKEALSVARLARPGVTGPSLYCGARVLRRIFSVQLEVMRGAVNELADGFDVVACPTVRTLQTAGVGAQAAVRRAAGPVLEQALAELETPLPPCSVVLVPGGDLAQKVAMTVTELPVDLMQGPVSAFRALMDFLVLLHGKLLSAVREAGFRSIAMPTLGTGGMGLPPHLVAIAAIRAVRADFCANPADPIHVRVACFEVEHLVAFNSIKDEYLEHFYKPMLAESNILAAVFPRVHQQEGGGPPREGLIDWAGIDTPDTESAEEDT